MVGSADLCFVLRPTGAVQRSGGLSALLFPRVLRVDVSGGHPALPDAGRGV